MIFWKIFLKVAAVFYCNVFFFEKKSGICLWHSVLFFLLCSCVENLGWFEIPTWHLLCSSNVRYLDVKLLENVWNWINVNCARFITTIMIFIGELHLVTINANCETLPTEVVILGCTKMERISPFHLRKYVHVISLYIVERARVLQAIT